MRTLHRHQSLDMVIFKMRKKEEDFNTDAGLTGLRFVDLELLTDFVVNLVSKLQETNNYWWKQETVSC